MLKIFGAPSRYIQGSGALETLGQYAALFGRRAAGLDYSQNEHRHEAVIEALEARDSEAAREAIQADLVWGGKIMIDWLVEREKELDYRPPGARK
ncbi:hypothetical protein BMR86_25385 [Stenotrophomonas sp. KAs 5-3]|nr:hypothetical protein BMR86_25385 [Stenotrophomonas sp. KAs 5-3]